MTKTLKKLIDNVRSLFDHAFGNKQFPGSHRYWKERYNKGGHSGIGSYRHFAEFKAEIINGFIQEKGIETVIEYGCGDGNQLRLAKYNSYTGFDISEKAITLCRTNFFEDKSKSFKLMHNYDGEKAQLTISLDVIYHLIEDEVYLEYLERLFDSSEAYVIIYSSNSDNNAARQANHVKHRKFSDWVHQQRPQWTLIRQIPNRYPISASKKGSPSDFYIFQKVTT